MPNNTGVKVTKGNLDRVANAMQVLAGVEVLVGFPEATTEREDPESAKHGITNAALGYIHDNGMPEQHIPARPFMEPGIKDGEKEIEKHLSGAMKATMRGNTIAAEQQMHAAGLAAVSAIRNKINEGIPPPLAEATLRDRARRGRKGAQMELERRAKGYEPLLVLAKPLIDTGEMRKALTYTIRSRKARRT